MSNLKYLSIFTGMAVLMGAAQATELKTVQWPSEELKTIVVGGNSALPDKVIVRFKQGVTALSAEQNLLSLGLKTLKTDIFPQSKSTQINLGITAPALEISTLKIANGMPVKEAIEKLEKSGLVEYAEPDYTRKLSATPNDTYFSYLWGMNNAGQTGGLLMPMLMRQKHGISIKVITL